MGPIFDSGGQVGFTKNLESKQSGATCYYYYLLQTIEPFFSKEITIVITEAPEWKLKPQTTAKDKLGGLNLAPSPSTSVGTQFANSPNWSPLSVQEDGLQKQQQKFQAVRFHIFFVLPFCDLLILFTHKMFLNYRNNVFLYLLLSIAEISY